MQTPSERNEVCEVGASDYGEALVRKIDRVTESEQCAWCRTRVAIAGFRGVGGAIDTNADHVGRIWRTWGSAGLVNHQTLRLARRRYRQ